MSARHALATAALFLSAGALAAQGTPVKPKTTTKPATAAATTAKPAAAAAKATDSTAATKKAMDSTKKHVAARKHKPTN